MATSQKYVAVFYMAKGGGRWGGNQDGNDGQLPMCTSVMGSALPYKNEEER